MENTIPSLSQSTGARTDNSSDQYAVLMSFYSSLLLIASKTLQVLATLKEQNGHIITLNMDGQFQESSQVVPMELTSMPSTGQREEI